MNDSADFSLSGHWAVLPPDSDPLETEQRLVAWVRWNALAMVVRANNVSTELGGQIASYASAADLFEVGFNLVNPGGDSYAVQPLQRGLGVGPSMRRRVGSGVSPNLRCIKRYVGQAEANDQAIAVLVAMAGQAKDR